MFGTRTPFRQHYLQQKWPFSIKKEGTTLLQKLTNLYEKFGYHKEHLHTITLDDSDGTTKMNQVIDDLRKEPTCIPGITVLEDFNE